MLSKFYESLYLKIFVNIVISSSKTTVYIEMLDFNGKLINSEEKSFNVIYLDMDMYDYISNAIKESPYHYISILDNSLSQGAMPTCTKNKLEFYHDISSCEYKCYKDMWTYYTEKTDIYNIEKAFEKIGVDFIFSPFVVLSNFFKDKIDSQLAIFVIAEESVLTLSVFNKSELLYAERLDMTNEIEDEELIIEDHDIDEIDLDDEEESINLDDIDALDDVDELDDFGDIADLDSIEEIDEFSEAKDIEEELLEQEDEYTENESEGFNQDYQRFSHIQSSINHFYQNDKYKSEFVENIYIADYAGVTPDLKRYLEEEMFLNVYIRHLDLCVEVCEMAKMELE